MGKIKPVRSVIGATEKFELGLLKLPRPEILISKFFVYFEWVLGPEEKFARRDFVAKRFARLPDS